MMFEQRIADLMRAKPLRFQETQGGYTAAKKGVVSFDSGLCVFVKAATDEMTATWLRTEYAIYCHLNEKVQADFLPKVLAWEDDGTHPVLILENLSKAYWPPPWKFEHVERVEELLSRVRCAPPMRDMASLESYRNELCGWRKIAKNPIPFLSLRLCSSLWLDTALPTLMAAEAVTLLQGNDFIHMDIRSDNLCFTPERTILIDWNWACIGNGMFDLANLLPSLHAEGGPPPESILPNQPEMAATVSGFWASRAGLTPVGTQRRDIQLLQLKKALPWAIRALGLAANDMSAL